MSQEILNILLSALGIIITGLTTYAVTKLTAWIDAKIKDKTLNNYMKIITQIVGNCVREVSQTYVDALKKEGSFDEAAQKKALEMCLKKIESELAPEIIKFIVDNFGDATAYLKTLIESTIYTDKQFLLA